MSISLIKTLVKLLNGNIDPLLRNSTFRCNVIKLEEAKIIEVDEERAAWKVKCEDREISDTAGFTRFNLKSTCRKEVLKREQTSMEDRVYVHLMSELESSPAADDEAEILGAALSLPIIHTTLFNPYMCPSKRECALPRYVINANDYYWTTKTNSSSNSNSRQNKINKTRTTTQHTTRTTNSKKHRSNSMQTNRDNGPGGVCQRKTNTNQS